MFDVLIGYQTLDVKPCTPPPSSPHPHPKKTILICSVYVVAGFKMTDFPTLYCTSTCEILFRPFNIPEARTRYLFHAEHPSVDHYSENPLPWSSTTDIYMNFYL